MCCGAWSHGTSDEKEITRWLTTTPVVGRDFPVSVCRWYSAQVLVTNTIKWADHWQVFIVFVLEFQKFTIKLLKDLAPQWGLSAQLTDGSLSAGSSYALFLPLVRTPQAHLPEPSVPSWWCTLAGCRISGVMASIAEADDWRQAYGLLVLGWALCWLPPDLPECKKPHQKPLLPGMEPPTCQCFAAIMK